jgi:DNA-binding response OmpR family regulator
MSHDIYALIVDDEEGVRTAIASACRTLGLQDLQASNNKDAIEVLKKYAPSIIITDYFHPGGSGAELIRAIREMPQISHIPIIMITAVPTERIKNEAWNSGVSAFLSKPFDFRGLMKTIEDLLRRGKTEDFI